MTGETKKEDKELLDWMNEVYGEDPEYGGEQVLKEHLHIIVPARILSVNGYEVHICSTRNKNVQFTFNAGNEHKLMEILDSIFEGMTYRRFLLRLHPEIALIGTRPIV